MKKRLFITSFALLVILFAGLGVNYLLSFHKVTFALKNDTNEITVFDSSDKEIKRLSSDGNILLQSGNYYVVPKGENLASDKIPFSVEKSDLTVVVAPARTKEYLTNKLKEEIGAIKTAVAEKYPTLINNYTLAQGALYEQGEWFGGLLKPKVADIRQQKDPYRIVLHKKDGKWEVIRRPEYVLTSSRYEEVPVEVLREINLIVGEPGN